MQIFNIDFDLEFTPKPKFSSKFVKYTNLNRKKGQINRLHKNLSKMQLN